MIKKVTKGSAYFQNPYHNNLYKKTEKMKKKIDKKDTVTISSEAMEIYKRSVQN